MPHPTRLLGALVLSALVVVGGAACSDASAAQIRATGAPAHVARTPAHASTPVPSVAAPDPVFAEARQRLASMSLDQRIASMLMIHVAGTDAGQIAQNVASTGAGGIILMGDNTDSGDGGVAAITSALNAGSTLPALVAIDEEGGEVSRLASDPSPGAEVVRTQPPAVTGAAFQARAALLRSLGISVNFGIVADVTADPDSFLAGRVLGTDTPDSAAHVAAAVQGESGAVLSTLKHFPGHGAAPGDSHHTIPVAAEGLDAWHATDEPSFASGIAAGAGLVMFGHLSYPAVDPAPASLSPAWHHILRDEMHFSGIAVTDDMAMLTDTGDARYADAGANAVAAVAAGNDLLLYVPAVGPGGFDPSQIVAAVHAAVADGRIPVSTIDRAVLRLLRARLALAE
ncbi:glycoside hydrolase family 3 N-terminal domain-containing protein [Glaciibacter flavus]|uniref:glycoside hydrolase family 3 N-terminal domain-containing protein n=1 Tax=Orlajensenia flava TaxID=2565934 RepID=UPI003AFFCA37